MKGTALAAVAALGVVASGAAHADCVLAGKWHMYTFSDGALPTNANAPSVNSCDITIAANGSIRGSCTGHPLGQPASPTTVTGKFSVNAKCALSGSYTPVGFPVTTIMEGHINGDVGFAAAVRGDASSPTSVRVINLIRD